MGSQIAYGSNVTVGGGDSGDWWNHLFDPTYTNEPAGTVASTIRKAGALGTIGRPIPPSPQTQSPSTGYAMQSVAAQNDPYADYMANLKTQQNPFGQNNPQFQSYLQGQMAAYRRNFGGQQQQLAGQLAGRGLMGSGMEAAQRGALAGQQAAGLSNLQTQAMGQQYQQGADWDKWKQQAMLQGLGGQSQDYLGRGNLALGQQGLALQAELGRGNLGLARSRFSAEREDAANRAQWAWLEPVAHVGGMALGGR